MSLPFPATAAPPPVLRARLVSAAVRLTVDEGWACVTMARLAAEVGVSRQTVYNEIGGKAALAEAVIHEELARFLGVVTGAFDAHPDDLLGAMRAAVRGVLELAQDNPLLHAVVSATHGTDTDLLPLLTTHSGSLLATAKGVLLERVEVYETGLPPARLEVVIDMVARVVLSHVMQPSGTPEQTAEELAWLASLMLTGTSESAEGPRRR